MVESEISNVAVEEVVNEKVKEEAKELLDDKKTEVKLPSEDKKEKKSPIKDVEEDNGDQMSLF